MEWCQRPRQISLHDCVDFYGNDINFSIAAGLSYICPVSSNLVCNKGGHVTSYPPRQSLAPFQWDSIAHWCQMNSITFSKICRFIVNIFHYVRFAFITFWGWVGLWSFLWWAPSAKRKDNLGVSSGWSSVWHHSNTGLSSTQYEQIPIILGVWPFWLTPFFLFGQ